MTPAETTLVNIKHTPDFNPKKNPDDIYIGRYNPRFGRSKWGNPFKEGNRDQVIRQYRDYLLKSPELLNQIGELRGKRLGCWCLPLSCHGQVLLELLKTMEGESHGCATVN